MPTEAYEPEARPGSIGRVQLQSIMIELAARGIKDHDDRVAELSNITGRAITSTNDLSYQEAADVIRHLALRVRTGFIAKDATRQGADDDS